MSSGTLSRKWLGRYPFDVDELESIAKALDVPLTSLIVNSGGDDHTSIPCSSPEQRRDNRTRLLIAA